ncbi:uncharacterized protein [Haliotis cracherodii]|uniref:uncharacterized protein n=1 Tax=Haliotis cracherodii TaxID=6455 RepID=UPI0039EC515E
MTTSETDTVDSDIVYDSSILRTSVDSVMATGVAVLLLFTLFRGVLLEPNTCIHQGKEFLIVMPKIIPPSASRTYHLIIQGPPTATVTVISPWNDTFKETIGKDSQITFHAHDIRINANFVENPVQKVAFRVSCPVQVNVYVYSDGADGYTALHMPYSRLSQDVSQRYVIASYKAGNGCKAYIALAAIKEHTLVNGTVRVQNGGKAFIGSQPLDDGQSFTNIQLGALDVMYIWSYQDLTGSGILADKYISVFSGFDCTCQPGGGDRLCHGIITQMPPVPRLKRENLPVPVLGYSDDTIFRVIAIKTNTRFRIPPNSTFHTTLVKIGDYAEIHSASLSPGIISGEKEILVMSYVEVNEAGSGFLSLMTLVRPGLQFKEAFRVYAIPSFDSSILILHPLSPSNTYSIIINDTTLISFDTFDVGLNYVVLRTEIEAGYHLITSANKSARISVFVYGRGDGASYSFTGACVRRKEEGKIYRNDYNLDLTYG